MLTRQIIHSSIPSRALTRGRRRASSRVPFVQQLSGRPSYISPCSRPFLFRPTSTSSGPGGEATTGTGSPIGRQPPTIQIFHSNIDKLTKTSEFFLVETGSNISDEKQNFKAEYKYAVTNRQGEKLFHVEQLYESFPPKFDLKIQEPNGETLVMHKLLQNLSSHLLNMQIIYPGSQYVGSIEEKVVTTNLEESKPPLYEIKNNHDEVQAVVLSNFSDSMLGLKRYVTIFSHDQKTEIGRISKKWNGFGFNDALVMSVQIPEHVLDAKFRISLISLCILLVQIPVKLKVFQ